jgi:hypothetical protein
MSDQQKQREQRGAQHLKDARKAHLESAGAPSLAPNHDNAVTEAIKTRSVGTKGSGKAEALVPQVKASSTKGHHSGRKHPVAEKAGGFDYAGASNGGDLNAQNAVRK